MKNILSVILIGALALTLLFSFAACGGKVEEGITSMMDEATTLMEEVSTALDDIADDMTGEGNVTDDFNADESTTDESLLGGDDEKKTTAVAE